MCEEVFLRNRMSSNQNGDSIAALDELLEILDSQARRITHNETRCKMNRLGTVLDHFFRNILDIATRAAVACGIADDL